MFEDGWAVLTRADRGLSDADRVDRLSALEQVKAACAAAQARGSPRTFAESQAEVAAASRQRARECADDNDFDGWRAAREQARRATVHAAEARYESSQRVRRRDRGAREVGWPDRWRWLAGCHRHEAVVTWRWLWRWCVTSPARWRRSRSAR